MDRIIYITPAGKAILPALHAEICEVRAMREVTVREPDYGVAPWMVQTAPERGTPPSAALQ